LPAEENVKTHLFPAFEPRKLAIVGLSTDNKFDWLTPFAKSLSAPTMLLCAESVGKKKSKEILCHSRVSGCGHGFRLILQGSCGVWKSMEKFGHFPAWKSLGANFLVCW